MTNPTRSNCGQCQSALEKIQGGLLFCRACKLLHDPDGVAMFTGPQLASHFNPLASARSTTKSHHKGMASVGKTALEAALIQNLHEAYMAGLKDGILLAYSQDYQEGEPMEKLGVSNEDLKTELRKKYNDLVEKKNSGLSKEASVQVDQELDAIKSKIDELDSQ